MLNRVLISACFLPARQLPKTAEEPSFIPHIQLGSMRCLQRAFLVNYLINLMLVVPFGIARR